MEIHSKALIAKEISFNKLLQTVTASTGNSLRTLAENSDVDYLIILENASKDKRKFIPAGSGLDFRTPKDATSKVIGGMRMSGFVDLSKSTAIQPLSEADQEPLKIKDTDSSEVDRLKRRIEWLDKANYVLENKISSAKKQILTRNQVIEEMKKQVSGLQAKLDSAEQNQPLNDDYTAQSSNLEAAEEELMTRMNEYMEKEAELDQREEDLFHQERRFHEMENKFKTTA
jgi:predicted nuclease with TOPRIM domain